MRVESFLAPNPGPITLAGTRSHVVGDDPVAIIDPGPRVESHLERLARAVAGARRIFILLTHAHPDHAAGAPALADALGVPILGPGSGHAIDDGQQFDTGAGVLTAIFTPGHARRHFCFHLERAQAVFVGDLLLGEGTTTWVGEYPGAVADYLASLDRIEALQPRILYPAHGPDIAHPATTIARFRHHRQTRIDQVRRLTAEGCTESRDILARVYGNDLPADIYPMALASVESTLDYLRGAQ